SPLGRARCIKRLFELEMGRDENRFSAGQRETLKASIAERMRLSSRSVSRYLLILEAPPAVQQAFDAAQLPLITAGKVALLPRSTQQEIARRIEAGELPGKVVASCLSSG